VGGNNHENWTLFESPWTVFELGSVVSVIANTTPPAGIHPTHSVPINSAKLIRYNDDGETCVVWPGIHSGLRLLPRVGVY
jgi:hypothetical protein